MKHTKGSWTFHQNGDGSFSILGEKLSDREYKWIAGFIQNGEMLTAEQIANAKLMAAAPDLLSACLMAKEELCFGGDWKNAIKIIDEVVDKATSHT